MTAYIEYVIIDNLAIDYLLLYAALRTVGVRARAWRVAFGAAIGTAFAVVMPMLNIPKLLLFVVKLLVGQIMVLVSGSFRPLRLLAAFGVFLGYTFAAGGAVTGAYYLLGGDALTYGKIPLGLVVFGVYLAVLLVYVAVGGTKGKRGLMREVKITGGGRERTLSAVVDTGNTLTDPLSGRPVSVMDRAAFERLAASGAISTAGARYIPYATIGGEGKLFVFEIEKMQIYCGRRRHIINNAVMGVSRTALRGAEIILNGAFK